MACNDQWMIIYSIEIIVPGITTSCPESCKQLSGSRYHSLDDQVIIPQKVVGGFHDAAGFITPDHMTKFPIVLTLSSFPEPSHRCTTLVTPCPRCHTDQLFQNQGVDYHAGGGALPNAIVPKLRSSPEPTARHLCNRFPCPLCHPGRTEAEDYRDENSKHHVVSEELQNPCPKYQQVRDPSQNVVLDTSCCASAGVEVMTFHPIVDPLRSLPDGGHRCTQFPCPKCHGRRSQNVVLDNSCCASAGVELMTFNPIVDPMRTLPDGGHRCTQFPCPKCHGRRSQNAGHGVQSINVSESGLPNPVLEVVKISFPEPPGHRCNRFPCPVCPPSAMSTAEVGHDEISKYHVLCKEMQTPCPKYPQVRDPSQNVVLDNSSCASAGVELMTFNPIVDSMRSLPDGGHRCTQFPCPKCHGRRSQNVVLDNSCASAGVELMTFNPIVVDPIRTLPDGGHRCTQFPCPKCHGRRSQNAGHGVQSINVSESGLPNPVPEVVKISFPEPTGHRCNRFPCPLCPPSAMSTAEVDDDENSKHHVVCEEMQTPRPKYQQVLLPQGVQSNPFPMRTLPDPGHRCTQFPCPKCHRR